MPDKGIFNIKINNSYIGLEITVFEYLRKIKKEILILICFSIISLVIGITILEFYFKNFYSNATVTQFDKMLGWATIPNQKIILDGNEYSTNSMGFRSREVDTEKNHILLIGDSVTWGLGVDDQSTLNYYLERNISSHQVLNAGVPGYGIGQYYLNLKKILTWLSPKIIILILYPGNDLGETGTDTGYGKSKPFFFIDPEKVKKISSDTLKFHLDLLKVDYSHISRYSCANLFSGSYFLSFSIFNSARNSICKTRYYPHYLSLAVTTALILKIVRLAATRKSALFFVLSPSKSDFKYNYKNSDLFQKYLKQSPSVSPGAFNKWSYWLLKNILQQVPIPKLDFFYEIKKNKWNIDAMYSDNDHFSSQGNKMFAHALHKFINKYLDLESKN